MKVFFFRAAKAQAVQNCPSYCNQQVQDPENRRHERPAEDDGRRRAVLDHWYGNVSPAVASNHCLEQQRVCCLKVSCIEASRALLFLMNHDETSDFNK